MKYLLILFLLTSQFGMAQTFTIEEKRIDTENILSTALNSALFDSVYAGEIVYFLANELITEDSPLVLKRKNMRAKILSQLDVINVAQYIVLGDFTIDWNNPFSVRIQIEVMPERTFINYVLVKKNGIWLLKDCSILKDN